MFVKDAEDKEQRVTLGTQYVAMLVSGRCPSVRYLFQYLVLVSVTQFSILLQQM